MRVLGRRGKSDSFSGGGGAYSPGPGRTTLLDVHSAWPTHASPWPADATTVSRMRCSLPTTPPLRERPKMDSTDTALGVYSPGPCVDGNDGADRNAVMDRHQRRPDTSDTGTRQRYPVDTDVNFHTDEQMHGYRYQRRHDGQTHGQIATDPTHRSRDGMPPPPLPRCGRAEACVAGALAIDARRSFLHRHRHTRHAARYDATRHDTRHDTTRHEMRLRS
jgi:hypothetical protein